MKGVSNAMEYTRSNKDNLINHLFSVMYTEAEKPYTEMDSDLVSACVELVLELQGKNYTLSNEEIEEKVSKIPFVDTSEIKLVAQEKKKKYKTKKILLIAAVIALLCALLAVFTTGQFMERWHKAMYEKYGSIHNIPVGEVFTQGNEEFILHGKSVDYDSVEEFYENEKLQVLMPGKLPDGIKLKRITVLEEDNEIIVVFDSVITDYSIHPNTYLPENIADIATETRNIDNHLCYLHIDQEIPIIQIYFEYNNSYYTISGTDEQALVYIIENLEISK